MLALLFGLTVRPMPRAPNLFRPATALLAVYLRELAVAE